MELLLPEVESILAKLHEISPRRQGVVGTRVKKLRELQFPPGVNVGRGKTSKYQAKDLYLIAIAFELFQFGMGPEKALSYMSLLTKPIVDAAGELGTASWSASGNALMVEHTPNPGPNIFLRFDPRSLDALTESAREYFNLTALDKSREVWISESETRSAVINLSALCRSISAELLRLDQPPAKFFAGLRNWANECGWSGPLPSREPSR